MSSTCLTPGCTGPVAYALRCQGCLDNLWTWGARGKTYPFNETPPRQWTDLTKKEQQL